MQINENNIQFRPGFQSSNGQIQSNILLNIDIVHKVMRADTNLDFINEIRSRCRNDAQEEIKSKLVESTNLAIYNKRTYRLDDIHLNMSPLDTFKAEIEEGKLRKETSYVEFYNKKYGWGIRETNQPVLINVDQKTGNKIELIPELCQMTELKESMRTNF